MKWKTKDGEIIYNKVGFCFIGEEAQKIMFTLQAKERKLPKILKGREDEIRIVVLNRIFNDKKIIKNIQNQIDIGRIIMRHNNLITD